MKLSLPAIFLLLLLRQLSFAQDTLYTLSGQIIDCQTRKPIAAVTVKLICSDGRAIEKLTDSLGRYSFNHSIVKKNLAYVVTTQVHSGINYLGSSEKFKFSTCDNSAQRTILKDLCLVKNEHCEFILPTLYFEKNNHTSFSIDPDEYDLDMLKDILLDNPGFIIEIGSHASKEEGNPLQLSQKRAEHIQNLLIKKGIAKKRLVIHVYGLEKPFVPASEIDNLKTKTEKEAALKKNRRVAFTILKIK